MANGLLIHFFGIFHALYSFYAHTRINNPLCINIRDLLPEITSSLAPQSVITYNKHCLASILNSIVSSVLSHWVLPYYAVVFAPFKKLRSRKVVPQQPTATGQQVHKETADIANPHTTCTGPTRPAGKSSELPRQELEPKSHDRTPPSEDASGGEVQEVAASHEVATGDEVKGGETDKDECRAHERVNDKDSRVEKSEDETTTMRPHAPQSMPLEGEWTGQASGGISKPTAPETDPTRPSRDPEDATGDDERRPDAPTEPPNMPEGMRGRGSRDGNARVETEVSRTSRGHAEATGEISDEPRRPTKPNDSPDELEVARVEEVETSLSKASRGVQEGPGDGDDEERRPGVPDEPPDEPYGEPRNPEGVEVEPGGKAGGVERNGCAAHDDADAEVDGEVAETRRDAEVEVESVETRREASVEAEEWSASTHE